MYTSFHGHVFCVEHMLEFHRAEITVVFPVWRELMFFRNEKKPTSCQVLWFMKRLGFQKAFKYGENAWYADEASWPKPCQRHGDWKRKLARSHKVQIHAKDPAWGKQGWKKARCEKIWENQSNSKRPNIQKLFSCAQAGELLKTQ